MKRLLLTALLFLIIIATNSQSYNAQHYDIIINENIDIKDIGNHLTKSIFLKSNNKTKVQDEKTISIKNGGYNAITVELYVKDGYEWKYLQSVRIPGGSTVTYAIGKYENYFNYGYMKQSENNYYSVASFHSSIITLY